MPIVTATATWTATSCAAAALSVRFACFLSPCAGFIFTLATDANAVFLGSDGPKRRKKRNRWGDATENKAAGLMGLPTAIVADMTSEQLEAYTLHLRIEEITQKLKIDDVVPADGDRYAPRTPSPLCPC